MTVRRKRRVSKSANGGKVQMRKAPVQERSRERVLELQTVAERLILERGLTGYSVREVLRETNTNIATFYQFFPNKKALVRSIVEKYNEALSAAIVDKLSRSDPGQLEASLWGLLQTVNKFYRDNPIALRLWPGIHADRALSELDDKDTDANVAALAVFLAAANGGLRPAQLETVSRIAVITSATVARAAAKLPPRPRNRMLRNHVRMVIALVTGE